MNFAYLHLILNHLPVIICGTAFGLLIVTHIWNSRDARIIAFALFAVAAVLIVPVYLTGEPAEEIAETIAGVTDQQIEDHEEAAGISFLLMGITGALSLLSLGMLVKKNIQPKVLSYIILGCALLTLASLTWTGKLGGMIRHSEFYAPGNPSSDEDDDE